MTLTSRRSVANACRRRPAVVLEAVHHAVCGAQDLRANRHCPSSVLRCAFDSKSARFVVVVVVFATRNSARVRRARRPTPAAVVFRSRRRPKAALVRRSLAAARRAAYVVLALWAVFHRANDSVAGARRVRHDDQQMRMSRHLHGALECFALGARARALFIVGIGFCFSATAPTASISATLVVRVCSAPPAQGDALAIVVERRVSPVRARSPLPTDCTCASTLVEMNGACVPKAEFRPTTTAPAATDFFANIGSVSALLIIHQKLTRSIGSKQHFVRQSRHHCRRCGRRRHLSAGSFRLLSRRARALIGRRRF